MREALARRGEAGRLDEAIAADDARRALQTEVDNLRAERNAASEAIGAAMREAKGDPTAAARADEARAATRDLKTRLDAREAELADADERLRTILLRIPNLPHPSAPLGATDEDAEVVKVVGAPPEFDFEPRDHLLLAGPGVDMERGARTSGARFAYLLGDVALLWGAIQRHTIATLVGQGLHARR